jgi:hypothetical protein
LIPLASPRTEEGGIVALAARDEAFEGYWKRRKPTPRRSTLAGI